MKQALLVGGLFMALANVAVAQGSEIHSCYGPSGSHFALSADTQTFDYQATISGATVAYVATLEVYHNGVLKTTSAQVVLLPPPSYEFTAPVDMSSWGLRSGDAVTFRLKVVRLGLFGSLLASHSLTGDVVSPSQGTKTE